eukprot:CAMPEP_0201546630 /NCGR_PEP_ID=MMETSP0173_2-20130828/2932_1 /ASSEMBLY_ACC=CAM_ASM_000268 /TAXON_ID=218659 /ORGANISM="Vexillifera sp., Strain DIVA3 564/2" /LENGTH=329 /DNA_ID=CAMNT_0047955353 /DNA_START=123 /DNA_END=1112 /DNA_ORIENTATION=-
MTKSYPSPMFAWSGNHELLACQDKQLLDDVRAEDVESSLRALLGVHTGDASDVLFAGESFQPVGTAEVVVLFLEPEMSTEQFTFYANGGSFPHVQQLLENEAAASLSIPYVSVGMNEESGFSSRLASIFGDMLKANNDASLVLVEPAHAPQRLVGALSAYEAQGHNVVFSTLREWLKSDEQVKEIATNGRLDVVVVCFDTQPALDDLAVNYKHDDMNIHRIVASLDSHTSDYVGVLMADRAHYKTFVFQHQHTDTLKRWGVRASNNTTSENMDTYFPPSIAEGLMVTLVLLIILFVGICCMCCIQTPDRFPTAPKDGSPPFALHDSGKK